MLEELFGKKKTPNQARANELEQAISYHEHPKSQAARRRKLEKDAYPFERSLIDPIEKWAIILGTAYMVIAAPLYFGRGTKKEPSVQKKPIDTVTRIPIEDTPPTLVSTPPQTQYTTVSVKSLPKNGVINLIERGRGTPFNYKSDWDLVDEFQRRYKLPTDSGDNPILQPGVEYTVPIRQVTTRPRLILNQRT